MADEETVWKALADPTRRGILDLLRAGPRTTTEIVEALPAEGESHQMLAEIRQKQGRWSEAIPHWRQVDVNRSLEPTGLLGLANALAHEKKTADAREAIEKLLAKEWPTRFGDVHDKARKLLAGLN